MPVWLAFITGILIMTVVTTTGEQIAVRDRLCVLEGGKVEKRTLRFISYNDCLKK